MKTRTWNEAIAVLAGRIFAAMQRKDVAVAISKVKEIQQRVKDNPKLHQHLQRHPDTEHVLTTAAVILYSAGPGPNDSGHKPIGDAVDLAGDLLASHNHHNWDELTEIAAMIYAANPGPGVNDSNQIQHARNAAEMFLKTK